MRKQVPWPVVLALVGVTLAALMVFPVPGVAQQAGAIHMEVAVGWDGKAMPGMTTPAVVTLVNRGSTDLSGVVEVVNYNKDIMPPPPASPPGTPPGPARYWPASAYGERVTLPAGGQKEVILWFPLQSPDKLLFRFRAGEEVLAALETKLPAAGLLAGGPLPQAVGVLGEIPGALEQTRILAPDGVPRAPMIISLGPQLFPESGEQLGGFRTILVTGEETGSLNEHQRQALADWVEQGGNLILAGGLQLAAALETLPEDYLDVRNKGTVTQRDWGAMAAWVDAAPPGPVAAAVARLAGQGSDWGPEDSSLARRVSRGQGLVTVLTFDPNRPPWNTGPPGQALWKRLLVPTNDQSGYWGPPPGMYLAQSMAGQVGNLPEEAFPGWRTVGLYLVIFLVLAGPVTYLVLRWRRRPEYAWMAVPVLAVVFAGGLYVSMLQGGKNVLANVVQMVEINPGQQLSTYTGVGLFAPTQASFTARLADPGYEVQPQMDYGWGPGGPPAEDSEPPYSIIRGSDLEVTFGQPSQWNMRTLGFRQDAGEALGGLAAELRVEGNRLVGKVTNDTGLHLDHVTLLFGSAYRGVGDIGAGETKEIAMEIPPLPGYSPQGNYGPPYPESWRIFLEPQGPGTASAGGPGGSISTQTQVAAGVAAGVKMAQPVPYPPGAYQGPSRPLTVAEQRRANLLDNWTGMHRQGPIESGWPLALVGWSTGPAVDPGIKDLQADPYYLTMLVLRPQLTFLPGPFTLPEGVTVAEVAQADVRGMFGYNNLQGMDGGSMTFAFRPHLPPEARVEEITVHLPFYPVQAPPGMPNPGPGGPPAPNPEPVKPGALEVYNPATGAWEGLAGKERFTLAGTYATEDGEVQVRVNGFAQGSGEMFYFLPPRVGYRGVIE